MRNSIILSLALLLCFSGCSVKYSFTGGTKIVGDTFSVEEFRNEAKLVQPDLSNLLSEALRNKFISETNLELKETDGDLQFSGKITNYNISQQGAQGGVTAAYSRLTITVEVDHYNKNDENIEDEKSKTSFKTSFSDYADYNTNDDFTSVESDLMTEIIDKLVQKVYIKSVVNW